MEPGLIPTGGRLDGQQQYGAPHLDTKNGPVLGAFLTFCRIFVGTLRLGVLQDVRDHQADPASNETEVSPITYRPVGETLGADRSWAEDGERQGTPSLPSRLPLRFCEKWRSVHLIWPQGDKAL